MLIFIGSKIVVADMLGIAKVPPAISLGATFAILVSGRSLLAVEDARTGSARP